MARNLATWNPIQDMMSLREAMDQLFQESFVRFPRTTAGNGTSSGRFFVPPADAWESEEEVVIELALPGANPDSVDVTFERDSVVISGEIEPLAEDRNWVLRERYHGAFQRRFNLNVPVEVDKVEANFHHGMLSLRLPKAESIKPRKITVKAA